MRLHSKSWRRVVVPLLGLTAIVFGIARLWPPPARAAEFDYQTNIDYIVDSAGVTHVHQSYRVTNNTATTALSSLELSTPTDDISNLRAAYGDGANIPTTQSKRTNSIQGYTYTYVQVAITFGRDNVGVGTTWDFTVDYDTKKLVETKGSSHTVYIPQVSAGNVTQNLTARLLVPVNYGPIHTYGAKPAYIGVENGDSVYIFSHSQLTQNALELVFGDSVTYNVNFNFPLHNPGSREQDMTVTLPPDTPNQKIFINGLDPKPANLQLDADQNLLATYRVPANTDLTVKTNIDGAVKYLDYPLSKSGNKQDLPKDLVKNYTTPAQYWQKSDPAIVKAANAAAAPAGENVARITQALDAFVINRLTYNNNKIKFNVRQGAVSALANPDYVVCLEYSDLLIALLRSQGIPARLPVGYAYSGNLKKSNSVVDSLHSWVEVYMPNIGWVNVDPTWGEKFNNFGKSDLDHFAFALWGRRDDGPTAVMGRDGDQNYQYDNTVLTTKETAPITAAAGQLRIRQYVLLPFISVVRYTVTAPGNVSGTNYQLEVRNGDYSFIDWLGDMAPAQVARGWAPVLGSSFLRSAHVRFEQLKEGTPILASATATREVWPLLVFVAVISGIMLSAVIQYYLKRRRKERVQAKKRHLPTHELSTDEHARLKAELTRRFREQARREAIRRRRQAARAARSPKNRRHER